MEINLGTVLNYKGKQFICVEIEKIDTHKLARESSDSMKAWLFSGENVKHVSWHMDDFSEGDHLHITGERIMLEVPGQDLQFIWTSHNIKKEQSHGDIGSQSALGESTDSEVEGPRVGDSGGEGAGEEAAG